MIAGLQKRCFAALVMACGMAAAQPVTGITFATSPGKLYLPLAEASRELDWSLRQNKLNLHLNSRVLDSGGLRRLVDGTVLNRHVFVHGFSSVPNYPVSHGCIRLPLTGGNPARFFYEWTETGTPMKVTRS